MTFKQLDPEKVQQIITLHHQGQSVSQIADSIPCAENTVKRHLSRAGLRPRWTSKPMAEPSTPMVEPTEPQLPEPQEPEPEKPPVLRLGEPPEPARRRAETQTSLSKAADETSDLARVVANTSFLNQALSGGSKMSDAIQLGQLFREVEKDKSAFLSSEKERVEGALQEAHGRLAQADRQNMDLRMLQLQTNFQLELQKFKAEIEAARKSDRLQELSWWRDTLERSPEFVSGLVRGIKNELHGDIVHNAWAAASAGGFQVGGLTGTPRPLPPPPERKVLSIMKPLTPERKTAAQEVLSLPEQELEAMQQQLESELQEGPDPLTLDKYRTPKRDLDREAALAVQLAQARRELEELRGQRSAPDRKVIRADVPMKLPEAQT